MWIFIIIFAAAFLVIVVSALHDSGWRWKRRGSDSGGDAGFAFGDGGDEGSDGGGDGGGD